MDWITTSEINKFVNLDVAKGPLKYWQEGLFIAGEVGDAMSSIGLKRMGSMLKHHYSVQQGNEAFLLSYETNTRKIIGGIAGAPRDIKMNKINNMMWVMDNRGEMLLQQLKYMDKKIPSADKAHTKKSEKFFAKFGIFLVIALAGYALYNKEKERSKTN